MAKLITAALLISFAVAIQASCPTGDLYQFGFTGGCTGTRAARFNFPASVSADETAMNKLVGFLRAKFGADKIPDKIAVITDLATTANTFADSPANKVIKVEKEAKAGDKMDWYPLVYATWPKDVVATQLKCGAWHACSKIQMICQLIA